MPVKVLIPPGWIVPGCAAFIFFALGAIVGDWLSEAANHPILEYIQTSGTLLGVAATVAAVLVALRPLHIARQEKQDKRNALRTYLTTVISEIRSIILSRLGMPGLGPITDDEFENLNDALEAHASDLLLLTLPEVQTVSVVRGHLRLIWARKLDPQAAREMYVKLDEYATLAVRALDGDFGEEMISIDQAHESEVKRRREKGERPEFSSGGENSGPGV